SLRQCCSTARSSCFARTILTTAGPEKKSNKFFEIQMSSSLPFSSLRGADLASSPALSLRIWKKLKRVVTFARRFGLFFVTGFHDGDEIVRIIPAGYDKPLRVARRGAARAHAEGLRCAPLSR